MNWLIMTLKNLTMEYEKDLLKGENIPESVKDAIKEFVDGELVFENLSEVRRKNYVQRLRVAARWIPDAFLNPGKDDLKKVIIHLNSDGYTESTKATYLKMLKKFYRKRLPRSKFEKLWENVKIPNPKSSVTQADLITEPEMIRILENSKNARDRALFATLYDSGCRIGEILLMQIRNLSFDDYGAVLEVPWAGKTGRRAVRIVGDSVPYLRAWLDNHPDRNNVDAPLFCNIADSIRGRPMTYDDVRSALQKTIRRAGISKRIHPHLFRHTRASILAGKVPESPLEAQMGWIHGSRQTATYVHLSGKQQDEAILRAMGIEIAEKENIPMPRKCPRCDTANGSNAAYCRKCWLPLDPAEAIKMKEKENVVISGMEKMDLSNDDLAILNVLKHNPDVRDDLLLVLLQSLKASGKFDELKKTLSS